MENTAKKYLRPVTDNISDAFGSFEKNAKTYMMIAFYMMVPSLILMILDSVLEIQGKSVMGVWAIIISIVIAIASIVVQISGQIAMIRAVSDSKPAAKDPGMYIKESFSSIFWKLIWTAIVTGFLSLLGLIALIIPGIVLMIYFSLAYTVCVVEKTYGWKAVKESLKKVDGAWWRVFGRLLVAGILYFGVIVIVSTISFSLQTSIGESASTVLFTLLNMVAFLFLMPFMTLYTYQIYTDLSK